MSAVDGHETQGLEFFSGALSFQNLREISRLIGRDLKGLLQDEMQKFEKLRQLRSVSCEGPEMRRKHQPAAEAALLEAAREAEEDAAGHRPSAAQKQQQIAELEEH